MAFAADLVVASQLTYAQLAIQWSANTLATGSLQFATTASPAFRDDESNSRPVGNWLILIDALVSTLPSFAAPPPQVVSESDFNQLVEYVARMCLAAFALNAQTPPLISNAQVAALLAAWNLAFGT